MAMPEQSEPQTPVAEPSDSPKDDIPGLFSSSPYAILALLAGGTGVVAVGSLGLEILTDRTMAQTMDLGISYLSLPLGIATLLLAGLTAADKPRWAAPSLVLGFVYFGIFWLA